MLNIKAMPWITQNNKKQPKVPARKSKNSIRGIPKIYFEQYLIKTPHETLITKKILIFLILPLKKSN